jgi:hypothetical protein
MECERGEEPMMLRLVVRVAAICTISLGMLTASTAQTDPQTDDWSRQDQKYMERMNRGKEEENKEKPKTPEDIRKLYLEEANALIRDRNYGVKKSEHYRIKSDDPRLDLSDGVDLLERFQEYFVKYWEGEAELTPLNEPSQVYLFYSYFKYNKVLTGKARFGDFRPAGHYRSDLDVITLHSDGSPLSELPGALVHEATHQLVEKMLFGAGPLRPTWVNEGLATYFQRTGLKAMGGPSTSLAKSGKKSRSTSSRDKLAILKRVVGDKKDPFSILHLLDMTDPGEFYGNNACVNYTASWTLTHYLLHGEDGSYRAPFIRYIQGDAALTHGSNVLLEALGVDRPSFESGWKSHIRKIRP